jgi:hypothetical protein
MSQRDPLDSFEDALFRAARRERTQSAALERTLSAVVASHRRRRSYRASFTVAGSLALAAGAALVLHGGSSDQPIQAEYSAPKHSLSSAAAERSAAARPELVPSASTSSSAVALRSGLAPSVVATTLEEEKVMLGRVRSELSAGKAVSALSLLDHYDKVSGGHLSAEATLLRVQALSSSGHAALAANLAQRFVDSDPNGPLAEQARAYIGRAGAGRKP